MKAEVFGNRYFPQLTTALRILVGLLQLVCLYAAYKLWVAGAGKEVFEILFVGMVCGLVAFNPRVWRRPAPVVRELFCSACGNYLKTKMEEPDPCSCGASDWSPRPPSRDTVAARFGAASPPAETE